MVTLDDAISELRRLNRPVPLPGKLPTEAQVVEAEAQAALTFHPDFRRYLLEASDVVVGFIEPVTLDGGHTALSAVLKAARQRGIPEGWIPVCEDNSNFYLITEAGEIAYWAHDGATTETWLNLATWISVVWIGGH